MSSPDTSAGKIIRPDFSQKASLISPPTHSFPRIATIVEFPSGEQREWIELIKNGRWFESFTPDEAEAAASGFYKTLRKLKSSIKPFNPDGKTWDQVLGEIIRAGEPKINNLSGDNSKILNYVTEALRERAYALGQTHNLTNSDLLLNEEVLPVLTAFILSGERSEPLMTMSSLYFQGALKISMGQNRSLCTHSIGIK